MEVLHRAAQVHPDHYVLNYAAPPAGAGTGGVGAMLLMADVGGGGACLKAHSPAAAAMAALAAALRGGVAGGVIRGVSGGGVLSLPRPRRPLGAAAEADGEGEGNSGKVGRGRLTVSKPVLKAPMVSALETGKS